MAIKEDIILELHHVASKGISPRYRKAALQAADIIEVMRAAIKPFARCVELNDLYDQYEENAGATIEMPVRDILALVKLG